jgi:hypothetical protein
MSDAWKHLDLQGEGLQSANLALSRQQKSLRRARLLLLAFPSGMHRAYLADRRGAWLYRLGALLCVLAAWFSPLAGVALLAGLAGFAVRDFFWADDRVAQINKALRKASFFSGKTSPPPGYRGRYVDPADNTLADYIHEKERERAGHPAASPAPHAEPGHTPRLLSFDEQVRLLKEMEQARKDQKTSSDT